jgi:alanine racemase
MGREYTPRVRRRAFLESSAAAVAATALPSLTQEAPPAVHSTFDPWLEINPAHLRANVQAIARLSGSRPILAVIKNNGYGLGVANVARLLEPLPGVAGVAVVKLNEAVTLRDRGIRKPILLMGPFDESNLRDMLARNITPMVYTPIGDLLDREAARAGRSIPIQICIDTGLGREGVPYREAPALVQDLARHTSVTLAGVMMTFTEDAKFDQVQLQRFTTLCGDLAAMRIPLGPRHAASTYTLFQHDNAWLDMSRVGMALYGIYPEPAFRRLNRMTLIPAAALRARVAYVKKLAAGDSAGYERAFVARQDTWVATLPVGHTDGWPRVAAKGARVRINGRLFPVIASVSASHTLVDIGVDPLVKAGDVATMWDWEDGSRPEDVSAACGASVYDLTMHLNPLLPRRILE